MGRKTIYPDMVFADNLRQLMYDRNLFCKDVAKICDRERKTVCHWANGYTSPTAWDLKQICMTYRVSADELLGLK